MRHRSTLVRQERPTGVGPTDDNQSFSHNITITANKKMVVMLYGLDPDTDMFQVLLIVAIVTRPCNRGGVWFNHSLMCFIIVMLILLMIILCL